LQPWSESESSSMLLIMDAVQVIDGSSASPHWHKQPDEGLIHS